MSAIVISVASLVFTARLEEQAAPATCAAFRRLLPYRERIIQTRWSGEACWIPLGDFDLVDDYENHTSHPAPGEILFPYGSTRFASKVGQLAGNHFLTVETGREQLRAMGRKVLWEGAQDIIFEARP